jgi:hypothetical protein
MYCQHLQRGLGWQILLLVVLIRRVERVSQQSLVVHVVRLEEVQTQHAPQLLAVVVAAAAAAAD